MMISAIHTEDHGVSKVYTYKEELRPQFHFTAPANWINDPHGMVYDRETKTWHLHHQLCVGSNKPHWENPKGANAWGHATSKDLIHWKHQPLSGVWGGSGTGFIDYGNTLGFGEDSKDVFLLFTGRWMDISTDRGMTYPDSVKSDFLGSDPCVFWYAPESRWKKIYFRRDKSGHHFELLESDDLREWKSLGRMKGEGLFECPQLFPIIVQETDTVKWIFHDASGKYQVGHFDGKEFIGEGDFYRFSEDDEFYASYRFWRSWDPRDRQVQMGWLRRGAYPDMPFSQQLTIPCELKLINTEDGKLKLSRLPVVELEAIRVKTLVDEKMIKAKKYQEVFREAGDLFDLECSIDFIHASEDAEVMLDIRGKTLRFSKKMIEINMGRKSTNLRLLLDRCSIETFLNEGTYNQTIHYRPGKYHQTLSMRVSGHGVLIKNLKLHQLKGIWPEQGIKDIMPQMSRAEGKEHKDNLSKYK
jgi:sucrose-6-phosphate hydrolase SacC (GH32 family)